MDYKRIFVCKCGGVGDVILTTPILAALKQQYPNSKITLLTFPPAVDIVQGLPFIDDVISLDKSLRGTFSLVRKVWRYDLALLLDIQYRPAFISFLAQIKVRAGNKYKRKKWLTHSTDEDPNLFNIYEPYNIANVINRSIGLDLAKNCNLDLLQVAPIKSDDELITQNIMRDAGFNPQLPYVVLAPYTAGTPKDWPLEYYRELAERLHGDGYQPVIIGTEVQRHRVGIWDGVINIMGMTTLLQTAAAIKHAALLVGGCSAPIHIAAAVNTPSVSLHGMTSPERWAPKKLNISLSANLDCSPCDGRVPTCDQRTCMYQISPVTVYGACINFLK